MPRWACAGGSVVTVMACSLLAICLGAAEAPAAPAHSLTCAYVEAGVPGPGGNVLEIVDHLGARAERAIIVRDGDEIKVGTIAGPFGVEIVQCSGQIPTVTNVDRIEYSGVNRTLKISQRVERQFAEDQPDLSGGPFEPGATPKGGGSQIEFQVQMTGSDSTLLISMGDGADTVRAGRTHRSPVSVDMNASEGSHPDLYFFGNPARLRMRVRLGAGDDHFSAAGGPGFRAPLRVRHFFLYGLDGTDFLTGTPGRDEIVTGPGDDRVWAGSGPDFISIGGPGRKVVHGGAGTDGILNDSDSATAGPDDGPDRIFGGPGGDAILVDRNGFGDTVNCGPARDTVYANHRDHLKHCEILNPPPLREP
jgi:hypothetical protein